MEGIFGVIVMLVVVIVWYARGGVILNHLFRGKTVEGGKLALEWSCEGRTRATAEEVLAAVAAQFSALPQKPNVLVGAPYLMRSDEAVVIVNGTLLMELWRIVVLAVGDEDAGDTMLLAHMGNVTTMDGVVPKLDKLQDLQRRTCATLERFVREAPSLHAQT